MKTKEIKEALLTNDPLIIEELFNNLYQEYYKLLFYISIGMTHNEEDTEELVNEAFVKAFKNIDKFDFYSDESNFKAWLVRIVKNETINFLNKKNKENYDYLNNEIIATNSSFDNFLLEFKEILNKEQLDILVLRLKYNLRYQDIAKIMEKDLNYIYSTYQKGLKTLRKYYKLGDFNENK